MEGSVFMRATVKFLPELNSILKRKAFPTILDVKDLIDRLVVSVFYANDCEKLLDHFDYELEWPGSLKPKNLFTAIFFLGFLEPDLIGMDEFSNETGRYKIGSGIGAEGSLYFIPHIEAESIKLTFTRVSNDFRFD